MLLLIGEVLGLLVLAVLLMKSGTTDQVRRRCEDNFAGLVQTIHETPGEAGWLAGRKQAIEKILYRAGIDISGRYGWILFGGVLLATVTVGLLQGIVAGFGILIGSVVLCFGYLRFRYGRRAAALFEQLPAFIDGLERSLGSGHSLQLALGRATERAQEPLQGVMQKVHVNVELGGNLGDELRKSADTMEVKEFQLMALAVDVNQRYGGSIKALLGSITVMIRQRERARREFSALTGETRFSAWVLGLLPLGVAGYMAMINPGYMESMWGTDEGRSILYLAIGFQVTGSLILWKMIKSI